MESVPTSTDAIDHAPAWFVEAISREPVLGTVESDGVTIAYRSWGRTRDGGTDLLLVHGGAAHARWWDHLAPQLARTRRVVAVDLSGHGDSGHRGDYSLDGWADDLVAVMEATGLDAPVIAGHSLGGIVTTVLARQNTRTLAGVIILDSPIEPDGPGTRGEADSPSFGNARVYPTLEDTTARFRPVPPQQMLPYIARYVAQASVRQVPGGWSWKFDLAFALMTGDVPRSLDGLPCPVLLVVSEHGILSENARRVMDASPDVGVVEIADAGHAMMLDQPLALLSALLTALVAWEMRIPGR